MIIQQKPKYQLLPSGERIMFTVYDANVLTNYNFKYRADIYISNQVSTPTKVATVKVSPNVKGKGIFDFSPIIDSYVSPDYEGGIQKTGSSYYSNTNQTPFLVQYHDIHRVDGYATNKNSVRYFYVIFTMEYSTTQINSVIHYNGTPLQSQTFLVYNGVLNETDILNKGTGSSDIGYNLDYNNFILNDTSSKFLSNGPTKQYVRDYDYLTLGFFQGYDEDFEVGTSGATNPVLYKLKIQFYYNGSATGSLLQKECVGSQGGYRAIVTESETKLQFAGVGPGNIRGAGLAVPANWDYYVVNARDDTTATISTDYTFYKQEEDCKGFETIRLTWLNKFGVWDYYNFTKKSSRMFSKESLSYEQQDGTWNEDVFSVKGYKGGTRNFTNKVTERITINTDYITSEDALWLEELFVSTDVFILEKSSTDNIDEGIIRKYITPVIIDSQEHMRMTSANDNLIQYSFSITKSIKRKTHKR
tara:strand:- start:1080 stop:2498 length:1419 start_codon:yes stop_codon:yes gene_type:complete